MGEEGSLVMGMALGLGLSGEPAGCVTQSQEEAEEGAVPMLAYSSSVVESKMRS